MLEAEGQICCHYSDPYVVDEARSLLGKVGGGSRRVEIAGVLLVAFAVGVVAERPKFRAVEEEDL